jgi:hypothetical protein
MSSEQALIRRNPPDVPAGIRGRACRAPRFFLGAQSRATAARRRRTMTVAIEISRHKISLAAESPDSNPPARHARSSQRSPGLGS